MRYNFPVRRITPTGRIAVNSPVQSLNSMWMMRHLMQIAADADKTVTPDVVDLSRVDYARIEQRIMETMREET